LTIKLKKINTDNRKELAVIKILKEAGEKRNFQFETEAFCCYITVDSLTTALQNGACTYQCISKQMHYKTLFSHNGYMKSLEFY
jgi:hypothetical protein